MKWALLGFTGLALLIYFYVPSSDEPDTSSPLVKVEGAVDSKRVSAHSVPFSSTSLATTKEDMNPSKIAGDKRFSESEIKSLEDEISVAIKEYNESIVNGEPDEGAIERITSLKEIYKQQALHSVKDSNK